jgi:hypothetical protein
LLESFRLKSREMVSQFDMQHVISAYEVLYQKVLNGKAK